MRTLTALAALLTALSIPGSLFGQGRGGGYRGGSSSGAVVAQPLGALGGSYAGQGMSRPLGGIAPPSYPVGVRPPGQTPPPGKGNGSGYRYFGPVYYVPNAFGSTFAEPEDPYTSPSYQPVVSRPSRGANAAIQFSDALPAAQPQTVIVNQYYGKDEAPLNSGRTAPVANSTDQPAVPSDYYLIAYKNRHVITALAYWVDGETLHYVTAANAHNQSSLSLIDLEMTTRLNADRDVPFAISAK